MLFFYLIVELSMYIVYINNVFLFIGRLLFIYFFNICCISYNELNNKLFFINVFYIDFFCDYLFKVGICNDNDDICIFLIVFRVL